MVRILARKKIMKMKIKFCLNFSRFVKTGVGGGKPQSPIMDSLHWQNLLAKLSVTATHDFTFLGLLGQHDTDRIVSILCHAAQGGHGK
jgi:hypothetical protein